MGYRIRSKDLRVRRTDDGGVIVYDESNDTGHVLNAATAIVFDACDGFTTIEEMAQRVAARTGLPDDVDVVLVALSELRDKGLLENNDPTTQALSSIKPGLSRRRVLQGLALGAAAIAAFPSIQSIGNASVLASQSGLDVFAAVAVSLSTAGTPVEVNLSATSVPGPGTLSFEVVSPPLHGSTSITGAVLTYTPDKGYVGDDELTYRALFFPEGTVTTTAAPTTTPAPTTAPPTTAPPTTAPPTTAPPTTPPVTTTSQVAGTTTPAPTTTGGNIPFGVSSGNTAGSRTAVASVASAAAPIIITVGSVDTSVPRFTG